MVSRISSINSTIPPQKKSLECLSSCDDREFSWEPASGTGSERAADGGGTPDFNNRPGVVRVCYTYIYMSYRACKSKTINKNSILEFLIQNPEYISGPFRKTIEFMVFGLPG